MTAAWFRPSYGASRDRDQRSQSPAQISIHRPIDWGIPNWRTFEIPFSRASSSPWEGPWLRRSLPWTRPSVTGECRTRCARRTSRRFACGEAQTEDGSRNWWCHRCRALRRH